MPLKTQKEYDEKHVIFIAKKGEKGQAPLEKNEENKKSNRNKEVRYVKS